MLGLAGSSSLAVHSLTFPETSQTCELPTLTTSSVELITSRVSVKPELQPWMLTFFWHGAGIVASGPSLSTNEYRRLSAVVCAGPPATRSHSNSVGSRLPMNSQNCSAWYHVTSTAGRLL